MNNPTDEKREVLLRVEDLCQYFKSGSTELKAVDGVSFQVRKGEIVCIAGGAGILALAAMLYFAIHAVYVW